MDKRLVSFLALSYLNTRFTILTYRKVEDTRMNHKKNADNASVIKEINKIKVTKPEETGFLIHNPTDLPIISNEDKRVVIGIDGSRCAAYFDKEEKAEKEFQALQMGAARGFTPNVFVRRGTYVVMETIQAPTLEDYLKINPVTKELTQKLLQLFNDFKSVGFTRLDQATAHIYLMPDGGFKVVNLHRHTKQPAKLFPQRLIKSMGNQAERFLQQVKEMEPTLYESWTKDPKFNATIAKAKSGESKR